MFCKPIDAEQLQLSMSNFEKLDDMILYTQNNTNKTFIVNGKQAHPVSQCENIKDIVSTMENIKPLVDDYYGNRYTGKKQYWFKQAKYNSIILEKLIENEKILGRYNIDIDRCVKFICCLVNTSIDSNWNRPMDLVVITRCNIGRETFFNILSIFCRMFPGVIDMKRIDGIVYVKVAKHILLNDPYIKERCNFYKRQDHYIKMKLRATKGTVYASPFCPKVSRQKQRELFMGITYVYNELAGNKLKTTSKIIDEERYGVRSDIKYVEVPIHILSYITKKPAHQILGYMNSLCKRTNYISKHNLGYSEEDYYSHDYKTSGTLHNPNDLCFNGMEGRPPITPTSYIIYPDKLEKTNLWKYIKNNKEALNHITIRYLKYIKQDRDNKPDDFNNFMKDFIYLTSDEIDEVCEDYDKQFKQKIKNKDTLSEEEQQKLDLLFVGDMQQASISSKDRLMDIPKSIARTVKKITLKQIEQVDEETGEILIKNRNKLPYWLHHSIQYIADCPMNEYKQILNVVNTVTQYIKETIQLYKSQNNTQGLNIFKSNLTRYDLFEQFEYLY